MPSSYALTLPCPRAIVGAPVKIHLTMLLFFLVATSVSLQYIAAFPLYTALVVVLCGPILLGSVLLHECGHLWMSRRLLGGEITNSPIVLWPFGGYTYCDGLSTPTEEDVGRRGYLKDDIKIAIMGPLMHLFGAAFWFAMYAAINNGDISDFTFKKYLTVISSGYDGFFSTLFQQSCLVNILLLWANVFIPVYPLDGGRLMTTSLLLIGVALNKAALLTLLVSILVSTALFAWSIASFIDGVGTAGLLAVLVALHVWAECYRLYSSIINGKLREHPLFGRDCYIYRDVRPSIFQMSTAARHVAATENREEEGDPESGNLTMVPTETDIDQSARHTDID